MLVVACQGVSGYERVSGGSTGCERNRSGSRGVPSEVRKSTMVDCPLTAEDICPPEPESSSPLRFVTFASNDMFSTTLMHTSAQELTVSSSLILLRKTINSPLMRDPLLAKGWGEFLLWMALSREALDSTTSFVSVCMLTQSST